MLTGIAITLAGATGLTGGGVVFSFLLLDTGTDFLLLDDGSSKLIIGE